MTEILFALMIISKAPNLPDQQVAVFSNREQCTQEAQNIIQQGPSAYCVPVNAPANPDESIRKMTALMKNMMEQMNMR